ncbi:hypothetical protein A2962_01570 [Candidatus Woesebacteria bacterium RIFCSPLOWO2_01_FULL_39_61]|uniref:Integral membrane protein n=1 Tax=Candidatus Woesebacteria bacterium RIFCSPHIGHO2_02_FULL_39_13 TaxID=1802505 RepID=A0A1F7Z4D5_9BACT|nr:MAG: hypothetical protein A2692_01810 [Candidatus Woesebacteria bacterium RIFCSPHIGHO2_01_FULL_39_95]OGM34533.1 MAG: hypothetical protein A3D01_03260 [Candidatus Woesebacteria bacterium RIFCSPHIGHO2_02_FULL_39_13]OGM38800.1 MAG: hypothetical protein A3E13_01155 [Candidatus Woesebacteria bacterium RIFCSPHIGHO2_12_FULL_40_20]OGM65806.1 MAG: hypothetical protein A2962_01570 [Candidatus Woesebacteria bacterium RIFCSPLOWO2_01_FULL_39_61]
MNQLSISIPIGNLRGTGPLGFENVSSTRSVGYILNQVISVLVGAMTLFATIWFLILLITAAYSWMNAGGDKVALENARQKMLHAVIGLTIVIVAIFVADFIGFILGVPDILNVEGFITRILNP